MEKDLERKLISMSAQIKNLQIMVETTTYSDTVLGYLGEYYVDNAIETACEVLGD